MLPDIAFYFFNIYYRISVTRIFYYLSVLQLNNVIMKKLNFKKIQCTIVLLFTLFSFIETSAQSSGLVFSWDKVGCQEDPGSSISLDSIPVNFSLKVCPNSLVTYVISGAGVDDIGEVSWAAERGELLKNSGLTVPILWDSSNLNGILAVHIMFKDETELNIVITIQKNNTNLILGWDKVGCQSDKDHVCEIAFDENFSTADCLLVCKSSKMTYTIFGEAGLNVVDINWTVTGGIVYDTNQLSTKIDWGTTNNGSIRIYIKLADETVIDRTICVYIVDSSLILQWEKIAESAVREIKYDTAPDDSDTILVYPDTVSIYKIGGGDSDKIDTIFWQTTGGYAYSSHSKSTPITWDDEEVYELTIFLKFQDGTTIERKINIVRGPIGGDPQSDKSIAFDYDDTGNQKLRHMIYIAAKPKNNADQNSMQKLLDSKQPFKQTEDYDDISYFPNPVNSELHIKWVNKENHIMKTIELYDFAGKMAQVFQQNSNSESLEIGFGGYPSGIYTLTLIYTNGERRVLKIVKQ
jgi:hypothetical protein